MSIVATNKKATHATKASASICPNGNFNSTRGNRNSTFAITMVAVLLGLCATTQVLCSQINGSPASAAMKNGAPLNLDDAFEYLANKQLDQRYASLYKN